MKLKIGTYNIQHGIRHRVRQESGTVEVDLADVTAVLAEHRPALCGINEIYGNDGSAFGNQPAALGKALGMQAVFAKAITTHYGDYGNALLSAYPIVAVKTVPIGVPAEQRPPKGRRYEDRVLLVATLALEERKTLTVLVCHFGLNEDEIDLAVTTALAEAARLEGPLVLMGDFNLTPDTDAYRKLAAALTDVTALAAQPAHTFPSHAPTVQIDYIFCNGAVKPISATVLGVIASDHCPVLAEVEL